MIVMAAASVPENQYGFVDHPAEPSYILSFVFFLLILISISIVVVFIKNMLAKKQAIEFNPEKFRLLTSYLKTAAICSILLGLIGTLTGINYTLLEIGISGVFSFDAAAGPIGEAMIFLLFGLWNAVVALILRFVCQWKANRLLG